MLEITAEEFKKRLDNKRNLIVIDVREDWEYDEVNIGVMNVPLGSLPQHLDKLPADKTSEIIVHCQSGRRSSQAQKYLTRQGYSQVVSVRGGIEAYLNLQSGAQD